VEKLNEIYGDKVEFFGVDIGVSEKLERVKKFVKEKGLKMPIFFDEEKSFMKLFEVGALPTTIVIDKTGIISYRNEVTSELVETVLDDLLKPEEE